MSFFESEAAEVRDRGVPPRRKIMERFVGEYREVPGVQTNDAEISNGVPVAIAPSAHIESLHNPVKKIDAIGYQQKRRQSIALCMIVKNEAPVIAQCLESMRSLIDYWVIADTGSTDGTQDIILNTFKDIPGELHQRPWIDFAFNRSEVLTLARPHADYSFIIDADDQVEITPGYKLPYLKADTFSIEIINQNRRYWRPQLVSNALPWRFEGAVHEFLSCKLQDASERVLPNGRSQRRKSRGSK